MATSSKLLRTQAAVDAFVNAAANAIGGLSNTALAERELAAQVRCAEWTDEADRIEGSYPWYANIPFFPGGADVAKWQARFAAAKFTRDAWCAIRDVYTSQGDLRAVADPSMAAARRQAATKQTAERQEARDEAARLAEESGLWDSIARSAGELAGGGVERVQSGAGQVEAGTKEAVAAAQHAATGAVSAVAQQAAQQAEEAANTVSTGLLDYLRQWREEAFGIFGLGSDQPFGERVVGWLRLLLAALGVFVAYRALGAIASGALGAGERAAERTTGLLTELKDVPLMPAA